MSGQFIVKKCKHGNVAGIEEGRWLVYYKHKDWGLVICGDFQKRSEALTQAQAWQDGKLKFHYYLRWWDAATDELLGDELLDLTMDEVHSLVEEKPDVPPIYDYPVNATMRWKLMFNDKPSGKKCKTKIDLNHFNYTIDCEAD